MSKDSKPDISVVIPVFNGEKTLKNCLTALFRSEGVIFDVIIVDDGSTDRSQEIASLFPVRLYSLPSKLGGGIARNIGSQNAMAPILLHTDADVEIETDTLKKIVEEFKNNPNLHAFFGAYSTDCPHQNFFSQYKNLHHHFIHHQAKTDAHTFWSGCGAIRKDVFDAVGGYHTFKHIRNINDIDLGYRLRKSGFSIKIKPHIQVKHHKYYSFLSLLKSDLFERAIPWTKIMWFNGLFKNDMNTRFTDSLSVVLVFISLVSVFTPWSTWGRMVAGVGGICAISLLNWRWFIFCLKLKGCSFAVRSIHTELVYFFICGVGLCVGSVSYFLDFLKTPFLKSKLKK